MQYIGNEWNITHHTEKLSGAGMETRKQKNLFTVGYKFHYY